MRIIDADTLKERIEKYRTVHLSHRRLSAIKREAEEVINDIYFAIDVAPTIDPVKHGRWVDATKEIGWPIWECSVCGGNGRGDYFVCPWCGAKMVEGGDAK